MLHCRVTVGYVLKDCGAFTFWVKESKIIIDGTLDITDKVTTILPHTTHWNARHYWQSHYHTSTHHTLECSTLMTKSLPYCHTLHVGMLDITDKVTTILPHTTYWNARHYWQSHYHTSTHHTLECSTLLIKSLPYCHTLHAGMLDITDKVTTILPHTTCWNARH